MLLPLRPAQAGQLPEWALIELQGKVEQLVDVDELRQQIGALQQKDEDSLQLTVGYHQLDAKRVPLKKPFLIISKLTRQQAGSDESEAEGYQVDGVVRCKWLFKQRPRALISKPNE